MIKKLKKNNKLKNFKKFLCIGLTSLCLAVSLPSFSEPVYAEQQSDGSDSDARDPNGSNNRTWTYSPGTCSIRWQTFSGTTTLHSDINKNSAAEGHKLVETTVSIKECSLGAYLMCTDRGESTWFRWAWSNSYSGSNSYKMDAILRRSGCGPLPDARLVEQAAKDGYVWQTTDKGTFYWNGDDYLDYVYVKDTYTEITYSSTPTIITVTTTKDGTIFDRSGETLKSLYENPTTEVPYEGDTGSSMGYLDKITATILYIEKETVQERDSEGNIYNSYSRYYTVGSATREGEIRYSVVPPSLYQTMFIPFDLNTNGPVKPEDVLQDYAVDFMGDDELDMTVENYQGITDGSYLNSLDTNTPVKFNVTFNNDYFGIDLPFQEGPSGGSGGSSYCEAGFFNVKELMQVDHACSGDMYWGLSLKMGLNGENGSLTFNDAETVGNSSFTKQPGWRGGDFYFKNIKVGLYKLANGYGTDWWEAVYTQGKYYSYGVAYKGVVTIDEVGAAGITGKDFNTSLTSRTVKQPILKGIFESKTVGGDID